MQFVSIPVILRVPKHIYLISLPPKIAKTALTAALQRMIISTLRCKSIFLLKFMRHTETQAILKPNTDQNLS